MFGNEFSDQNRNESSGPASPVTILWHYGVFLWIPYVLVEAWLIINFFKGSKKNKFSSIAIFLTLLQRPYIYSLYWAFIIIFPIVQLYKSEKQLINY